MVKLHHVTEKNVSTFTLVNGRMMEQVDIGDLKSPGASHAGSIPAPPTSNVV